MTNKVSIAQGDPIAKMKNLPQHSFGGQPAERRLMLVLLAGFALLTILLDIYSPPVTTFTVFIAYAVIFSLLKLCAREHRSVDRIATQAREYEFTQPLVSIVIPAHNEERVIAMTIKSMLQLDYPSYELLVVDDRSTDQTAAILRTIKMSDDPRFRYFSRPEDSRAGKAASINEALSHTNGKLIAVFDADAQVEPDFLTKMVPYFANPLVGAVQGKKKLINGNQNLLTTCQKNEYYMDHHFQAVRDTVRSAVELRGNGMLLRRTALEELGGLNERAMCEDLDLCTRLHAAGWDLRFAQDALVAEEAPTTLSALFKQRVRWTEGSILRYIDHAPRILFNKKLALRTKLDAVLFIFEFIGPFWLLMENIALVTQWANGTLAPRPLLFAAPAMTVLCLYFIYASFVGIYKEENRSFLKAIQGALMVYFYLTILFVPIVFRLMFKFLKNNERDLSWYKPPRYGAAMK
ncbi:MAG: glycosyltransferase family 2 protein [Cyanobacteria bacterium SZAS-4]|nr:glycosyltransferase family 2 protein [Cyanobacteria bacterium SZAS-4]